MTSPNKRNDVYFNQDTQTLSGNYVLFDFMKAMDAHAVLNDDAAETIEVSYDGGNLANEILATEAHTFDDRRRNKIYARIKDNPGSSGINFRISAWVKN